MARNEDPSNDGIIITDDDSDDVPSNILTDDDSDSDNDDNMITLQGMFF